MASATVIAFIVAAIALAFAWVAGWLTPDRLTPARFTNAIETSQRASSSRFPARACQRRVHGRFILKVTAEGVALSRARLFAPVRTPFIGRMSIGGGSPYGLGCQGARAQYGVCNSIVTMASSGAWR
jgi:catalase